jgi:hypothetical protein
MSLRLAGVDEARAFSPSKKDAVRVNRPLPGTHTLDVSSIATPDAGTLRTGFTEAPLVCGLQPQLRRNR